MCAEEQTPEERDAEKRKEAQERLQYEEQNPHVNIEDIKRALKRQKRQQKGE